MVSAIRSGLGAFRSRCDGRSVGGEARLRRHAFDALERLGLGILHGLRRIFAFLQHLGQLGADDVVQLLVVRRAQDRWDVIGDLLPRGL